MKQRGRGPKGRGGEKRAWRGASERSDVRKGPRAGRSDERRSFRKEPRAGDNDERREFRKRPRREDGERSERPAPRSRPVKREWTDEPRRKQSSIPRSPERPMVFGERPVEELLRWCPERVKSVLIRKDRQINNDLRELLDQAGITGGKFREVSREELDGICSSAVHQGIVAYIEPRPYLEVNDILDRAQMKPKSTIVLLDQITDPQNYGSVLRACESAGVNGVFIPDRNTAPLSGVAAKASSGASELVELGEAKNFQRLFEQLKDRGYWIYGTTLSPESQDLYDVSFADRSAIVVGSEGKGLRSLTAKMCDVHVRIPMTGKVQSLNVSQAASVVLFEMMRQRRKRD